MDIWRKLNPFRQVRVFAVVAYHHAMTRLLPEPVKGAGDGYDFDS